MKTKLFPSQLIAFLFLSTTLLTPGAEKKLHPEANKAQPVKSPLELSQEQSARMAKRGMLPAGRNAITRDTVRQRLERLEDLNPNHRNTHGYFVTLINQGYDPLVLDGWLNALYDGTILVGMPGDLVLNYYGEPLYRNNVTFNGAPATEWGVQLPDRVENVIIANGRVVSVTG